MGVTTSNLSLGKAKGYPGLSLERTEDYVDMFTSGSCHVLANKIHKLTDWPIHCFLGEDGEADIHAFVVPCPGWRLDVDGLREDEDHNLWLGLDPNRDHRSFSYEEIVDAGWVEPGELQTECAEEIAPLLITIARTNLPKRPCEERHPYKEGTPGT